MGTPASQLETGWLLAWVVQGTAIQVSSLGASGPQRRCNDEVEGEKNEEMRIGTIQNSQYRTYLLTAHVTWQVAQDGTHPQLDWMYVQSLG